MIQKFTDFINETNTPITITEKSELAAEYQEFFLALLQKYNVESVAELSDEDKIKFFDEIKDHYTTGKGLKDSGEEIVDKYS